MPIKRQPSLLSIAVISLALLLSGCAHFTCPDRGGAAWRELKSEHFVLQTDVNQAQAKHIIEQLELMRAALVQIITKKTVVEPGRLAVIVIAEQQLFSEYVPSKEFTGLFRHTQNGDEVILVSGDPDSYHRRIIAHELTHSLSLHLIGRQPLWFAEGLAGYFETIGNTDGTSKVEAGLVQPYYWNLIREEPATARKALEWKRAGNGDAYLYALSWLLVHYLIDNRPRDFNNYQNRLARGEEPRAAWNATFPQWNLDKYGAVEKLDDELDTYRLLADFKTMALTVSAMPVLTERLLSSAEVHTIRLDWKIDWTPQELASEIQEALVEDHGHVRALISVAEKNPDRAHELALKAVAAHPEDPRAWQFLGLSVRGENVKEERETAFRKALELDPGNTRYLLNLAATLVDQNRADKAVQILQRAVLQAPWSWVAQCSYSRALNLNNDCAEAANNAFRCSELLQGENVPEKIRLQLVNELAELNKMCRFRK